MVGRYEIFDDDWAQIEGIVSLPQPRGGLGEMTGIATLILENQTQLNPVALSERYRQHNRHQLEGIEALECTTRSRSNAATRSRLLHRLIEPDWREHFLTNAEALFEEPTLSEE